MGMSMLDAVYEKCQLGKGKMAEGGDWADVIKVLTAGKVGTEPGGDDCRADGQIGSAASANNSSFIITYDPSNPTRSHCIHCSTRCECPIAIERQSGPT
jgi:hypothetical protein